MRSAQPFFVFVRVRARYVRQVVQLDLLSYCSAWRPLKIASTADGSDENGNWSSFQLANSAPPLSVTGSAIAPSARMRLALM
jgi:hypothetical protein